MNEVGLFLSTFGGAGLFIVFLINRDKTVMKEQSDAINKNGNRLIMLTKAIDDLSYLIYDLLDNSIQNYGKRGNTQEVKERLDDRRHNLQNND